MIGKFITTIRNRFQQKGLVLLYHRITEDRVDPWDIAVTPRNFEQQIEYLSMSWNIVSLESMVSRVQAGKIPKKSVAICFDDGYQEHFSIVKPLLERYKMPATFFIPSYNVVEEHPFWWNELLNLVLYSRHLPPVIELNVDGELLRFEMERDTVFTEKLRQQYFSWRIPWAVPNKRCQLFGELWERLRKKDLTRIQETINDFRKLISVPPAQGTRQLLNKEELQELAASPLFSIGLHSHAHLMLGQLHKEEQRRDLMQNLDSLQKAIGTPAPMLAYPYGSFNEETLSILSEQNLKTAFTQEAQTITTKSPLFELGRIKAKNINWRDFDKYLKSVRRKSLPL